MPAISLVVCVYKERELLQRLLSGASGCYDDLVVVHDGPDTENVREVAERAGGRFFEHPRVGSLEGQSPFAWGKASHDWILRLDADEFPGEEMKSWLQAFRGQPAPAGDISGYTCIWPLWDGKRMTTKNWPQGRIFLFNKQSVRFFGLPEQVPIPDGHFEPLPMILNHQPQRPAYGIRNILLRPQAARWRELIAEKLCGKPTDLPCWRWDSDQWPPIWEGIRQRPLRTAMGRLTMGTFRVLRQQWRFDHTLFLSAAVTGSLHHALICVKYWKLQKKRGK